jgi:hypothetical protein
MSNWFTRAAGDIYQDITDPGVEDLLYTNPITAGMPGMYRDENIGGSMRDIARDVPIVNDALELDSSADIAAAQQEEALGQAQQHERAMFEKAQGYLDPYAQAGGQGFQNLQQGIQSGRYSQDPFSYGQQQPTMSEQDRLVNSIPAHLRQKYAGNVQRTSQEQERLVNSIPAHLRQKYAGNVQTAPTQPATQGMQGMQTPQFNYQGQEVGSISDYMGSMEENPAYQYQMEQMQKGIDRAGAAGGRWGGGQTAKEMMRGMGGIASQSYGDMWNRATQEQQLAQGQEGQRYSRAVDDYTRGLGAEALDYGRARQEYGMENERLQNLLAQDQGLANVGLGTAGQLANLASGQGSTLANLAIQQGNAQSAATMANSNQLAQILSLAGQAAPIM